jgi:hypothetical protein
MKDLVPVRSIIVDDLKSQIDDVRDNLRPALEAEGYFFDVVKECEAHWEASEYLVRHPDGVDLVVTDILWPRPSGSVPRQASSGLGVIGYAAKWCPSALLVALSLGDENHITVERDALKAGAHIVRLHGKHLPGDNGLGWMELGQAISSALRAGVPYPISPSPEVEAMLGAGKTPASADGVVEVVAALKRIPQIAKPLVDRRKGRPGITVRDEYDLQDLVECVLWTLCDDVRAEERTPSSAGSSSVMDFLLLASTVALEVKVATKTHGEKELKAELLVDRNDYRTHPSVRRIVAVVFDLASAMRNPRGFETDLTGRWEGIEMVTVVVDAGGLRREAGSQGVGTTAS